MHKQYVFNNHSSFFEIRENASLLVNGLKNPWKKKKKRNTDWSLIIETIFLMM